MTKTSYKNIPAAPPEETAVAVVVVDDTTFMDEPAPPIQESAANVQQPPGILLGRSPFEMTVCPKCSETDIRTRTRTYPTLLAWICVAVVAVVISPALCWIPLIVDPLKHTDHYCQKCGEKIGETRPLEDCCLIEQV
jgi:hypothetical protein